LLGNGTDADDGKLKGNLKLERVQDEDGILRDADE